MDIEDRHSFSPHDINEGLVITKYYSVCGIAKAVWLDREAGVKLCEDCYWRGLRKEAEESGVV